MTRHPLHDPVDALIRRVARDVVMAHFRNLSAEDVVEKEADDLVTVADREAERRLTAGLAALDPDARIVGEEATASDASLLDGLDKGRIWLIDPIDGTNNYAHGRSPFAIMLALLEDGDTVAAWIYDPVLDRLCSAVRGGGAWIDGRRMTVAARDPLASLRAAISLHFMDDAAREETARRTRDRMEIVATPRCAGEQYPQLVLGQADVALFQRVLPWDHAAGALFLAEAGGVCRRADGSCYRVADHRPIMLAATTDAIWRQAAAILFD